MLRRILLTGLTVAISTAALTPARATDPGTNGQIAFSYFAVGGIGAVQPDGSGAVTLVSGGSAYSPAWSPDGTQLAYVAGQHQHRLVVSNADGTGPNTIKSGIGWIASPSWSADGSMIAFLSRARAAAGARVTLVNADGTGLQRVGPVISSQVLDQVGFRALDWSPTGTIAFLAGRFATRLNLIQPDGSGRTIIPGTYYFAMSWSPDGTQLAVARSRHNQATDIVVMNADGSGRIDLTRTARRWEWTPAWSPDGTQIAFARSTTSSDQSQDDVWVMNTDGSSPTKIVHSPTDEFELAWQPT